MILACVSLILVLCFLKLGIPIVCNYVADRLMRALRRQNLPYPKHTNFKQIHSKVNKAALLCCLIVYIGTRVQTWPLG